MLYTDEQGSVIATANSSSTSQYVYSPTGEPTSWSGTRFRYTGQAALSEVQLYYYKARMYDPHLGRFLQTDPVGYIADYNLYAYVGNDPVNEIDSTGTCPMCWGGAFGFVVGAGLEIGDQYLKYGEVRSWTDVGQEGLLGGIAGATGTGAGELLLKAEAITSLAVAVAPTVSGTISATTDALLHGDPLAPASVRGAVFGYLGGKAGEKMTTYAAGRIEKAWERSVNRGAANGSLGDQLIQSGSLSSGSKSGKAISGATAGAAVESGVESIGDAASKFNDSFKNRFCTEFQGTRLCP